MQGDPGSSPVFRSLVQGRLSTHPPHRCVFFPFRRAHSQGREHQLPHSLASLVYLPRGLRSSSRDPSVIMAFIITVSSPGDRFPPGIGKAVSSPFRPQQKCHLFRKALPDHLSKAAPRSPADLSTVGYFNTWLSQAFRWPQL